MNRPHPPAERDEVNQSMWEEFFRTIGCFLVGVFNVMAAVLVVLLILATMMCVYELPYTGTSPIVRP